MTLTVPALEATAPVEPSPWLDIAAELRRIADDMETLAGEPAPGLVSLNIQPHNPDRPGRENTVKNRAATVAAVDAVAIALLGCPAKTELMSAGVYRHTVHGERGPIFLGVYTSVADPNAVDPQQEIERLRAEVQRLRAEQNGLLYTRADEGAEGETCLGRDMDCGRSLPCPDHPTSGLVLTERAREVLTVAPVSPARVPLHIGVVDDEGDL